MVLIELVVVLNFDHLIRTLYLLSRACLHWGSYALLWVSVGITRQARGTVLVDHEDFTLVGRVVGMARILVHNNERIVLIAFK
jgi:hypothetical protein